MSQQNSQQISNRFEQTFSLVARAWYRCGVLLSERPAQFLGILVGSLILVGVLGFSLKTSIDNKADINHIQNVLCEGESADCQILLDRLLADPSPTQVQMLKNLVKEQP